MVLASIRLTTAEPAGSSGDAATVEAGSAGADAGAIGAPPPKLALGGSLAGVTGGGTAAGSAGAEAAGGTVASGAGVFLPQ